MNDHTCICCNQPLRSSRRDQTVQSLAMKLAGDQRRVYPRLFSLIQSLSLCAPCLTCMPMITDPICSGCGREIRADVQVAPTPPGDKPLCLDCAYWTQSDSVQPLRITNRSTLGYDEWSKAVISRFKYRGDERLCQLFGTLLAITFYQHYASIQSHLITYVPLHETRLAERGFNQAERIAHSVGHILTIPVWPLLARVKNTQKLSQQKGKLSRLHSMSAAFRPLEGGHTPSFSPKPLRWWHRWQQKSPPYPQPPTILLIDDIYTTGSTTRACARAIQSIEAYQEARIYSLTISR